MQNSVKKALLFVIALSTSIIAVELVPVNVINKGRLLCAEFNSLYKHEDSNYKEKREMALKKLKVLIGEDIDFEAYCNNIWLKFLKNWSCHYISLEILRGYSHWKQINYKGAE